MKLIDAAKQLATLERQLTEWAYCALDCCVTGEIQEVLDPRMNDAQRRTYLFDMAAQSPGLAMMRRGVLVDQLKLSQVKARAKKELKAADKHVGKMPTVLTIWDGREMVTGLCKHSTRKDYRHKWSKASVEEKRTCEFCGAARFKPKLFNANSHHQTKHLLYDLLEVKKQTNQDGDVTADEKALDKIGRTWPKYKPLTDAILEVRGLIKQLGLLNSKVGTDGRMHSSNNVGAAWTGRWSSSADPYKEGTNLQNIAEKNRVIFVPDPGCLLGYSDLMQSDSRVVAYVAGDVAYIEAHERGAVHVEAARIFFPDVDWTGDLKDDKKICKGTALPWDADHTYYDQSKRNQHGLNFGLMPQGLAMHSHQPLPMAVKAYERYFTWAPRIKAWQQSIAKLVKETGVITNPLGRGVHLFGRPWDKHTVRQGISFIPQSTTSDVLVMGIWRAWQALDPERVQLLANIHDAILFQFPAGDLAAARAVSEAMRVTVPVLGNDGKWRDMVIPPELATGHNWGHASKDNPNGMEEV